jgi:predicted helicase
MRKAKIYYARMDELWRKEEKLRHLEKLEHIGNVDWQEITPDQKHTWLTEGLESEFDDFILIGNREQKTGSSYSIFGLFSNGNDSGRDDWVYNFCQKELEINMERFTNTYNSELDRWHTSEKSINVDDFLINDEKVIKWTRNSKRDLRIGRHISFSSKNIRNAIYRPFVSEKLCAGKIFNKEVALIPKILPLRIKEIENWLICLTDFGSEKPFMTLAVNMIPDLHLVGSGCGTQCFPFYAYDEDGTNRRENITDWSLEQFQTHYQDPTITKWDIFHYTYAVLHHPHYRTRYAANLKRELPRIPFAPTFRPFATAGKRLAEIHIHYEQQPQYPLKQQENKDLPIDWRVEKMRLSKDKTQLKYNDFLTLTGIPPEVFEYRLGNRSALHWVIDQYQVSTDKRSGITNDPNRLDDEEYIVRLIKQVITVSLETVQIVNDFPDLGLPND